MSLFKQLVIMLTLFLGVILISVMLLNFKSATEFVQNQLYSDAKNTAHSLGLSLSKVADPSDSSSMETMINAIYDSGYYQRIRLVDIDGKEVYNRESDVRVSDVPSWFIEIVPIKNASATSDIMMGWSRFGTLEVSGHTGNAYRQLYQTLIKLSQTFLLIGLVVFGVLYGLLKLSLKSLERIRVQAKAILENEFIIETKIPFTTEFRSVTTAMNVMVAKVKDIFERENETLSRYHELLYKDTESKLHNRRYLMTKLPDYLQSGTSLSSGAYMIFSFCAIDRFKREMGYERYTNLIAALSDELNTQIGTFSHALIARLNEADFFAVIPACEPSFMMDQAKSVMERMRHLVEEIDASLKEYLIFGCSIGCYSEKDTLKSLFSRADHAIIQAKLRGNFTIELHACEVDTLVLGRDEWRRELLESLEESRMILAFQSVVEKRGDTLLAIHEEIFLRLLDKEGTIHSAGYFLPVATRLGLIDTLDRYGIEKVLGYILESHPLTPPAINLSGDFIKKHDNIQWLQRKLQTFAGQSTLVLWFEVSNTIVLQELEAVRNVCAMVRVYNYHFGIDHFTIPKNGASYLQVIHPDYVKSSAAYLQDMMIDKESGQRSESFNNLLRSLGISLIAMNVEGDDDLKNLQELGVERFQGTYIAPVTLLK